MDSTSTTASGGSATDTELDERAGLAESIQTYASWLAAISLLGDADTLGPTKRTADVVLPMAEVAAALVLVDPLPDARQAVHDIRRLTIMLLEEVDAKHDLREAAILKIDEHIAKNRKEHP